MATSVNRSYPLPSEENDVDQEFWTLMLSTIPMIDHDIQSLFDALAGKADADHEHGVADIAGLVDALAGKMPASKTFAFGELSDVVGMDVAPDGYVPVKIGGQLVMMSMAAAVGGLEITMGQVAGLGDALAERLAKASNLSDLPDPVAARQNLKLWAGTEAEYDAIETKDPDMLYFTKE